MKLVFKNDVFSYVALLCSILLVSAIVEWPSEFYKALRIAICIGAVFIALKEYKILFTFFCFALIAYLFNPIMPVYLYQKSAWIPVDIICAIIFLLSAFTAPNPTKPFIPYTNKNTKRNTKSYGRDKKY